MHRLSQRIVIAVAPTAGRGGHPGLGQPLRVADRQVLRAAVARNNQSTVPFPRMQRLLQSVQHEVAVQAAAHLPTDDAPSGGVDHERIVDEDSHRPDVCSIRDLQRVRPGDRHVAVDQVVGSLGELIPDAGAPPTAPRDAPQAI